MADESKKSDGAKNPDERKSSIEAVKAADLRTEIYKESADSLKFALKVIITLIGLAAALVLAMQFKNAGEYREAVREAKEAEKEAKDASNHAQDWEDKAQKRFSEINDVVEAKIKEIEDKGKVSIANLIKEAERQRRANDAWNAGNKAFVEKDYKQAASAYAEVVGLGWESPILYTNWGMALSLLAVAKEGVESDKLFSDANEKFQKATELKPDFYGAYFNWGGALSQWAEKKEGAESDKLFIEACEKFKKVDEIKPNFPENYDNWGGTLLEWAIKKKGAEREKLLGEAIVELKKVEELSRGMAAYELGRAYYFLGNEEECKKWLKFGEEKGTLLRERQQALENQAFETVRDKEWFKNLKWRGEK